MGTTTCVESYNAAASSFNSKMSEQLAALKTKLGMKIAFVDTYRIVEHAVNNPTLYG
jgi:phospholipase/lecithinase/hemolysin